MNPRRGEITSLDLELFRDGELSEAGRDAVAEALREDPALRERLGAAARVDGLARRAMLEGATVELPAWRWRGMAAGWACAVLLAAGVTVALVVVRRPAVVEPPPVVANEVAAPASYRIVWSIPVSVPSAPPAAVPADPKPVEPLERVLAAGDAQRAAELLAGATPEARAQAYRKLGEIIRSAEACERVLDSMEPAQQLSVCREWAMDPRLRPVTFARLAKLAGNSAVAGQYAGVVGELAGYPELRPWLRSYVGVPSAATPSGRRG